MPLQNLPYDLLLNIARYMELADVQAVQLTCRSLRDFATTRPVFRNLANALLLRCRALPLSGFQSILDLSTEQLIKTVNRATYLEHAFRTRTPRSLVSNRSGSDDKGEVKEKWYKVVSAPPGEEIDWLSPITSSYTLCATKSGKVVCWHVDSDIALAEWNPGEKWELWKCRVEFEERAVYFTMARVVSGGLDDNRVMELVLMKLYFPSCPPSRVSGVDANEKPVFSHVTEWKTIGVIMNIFLLCPPQRLLSAFRWLSASNTIALYVLLDWDKDEYTFIDTGIECEPSNNWSCIHHDDQIIVHCEEPGFASQHFYPLSLLQGHAQVMESRSATPRISTRLLPARTVKRKFVFPKIDVPIGVDGNETDSDSEESSTVNHSQSISSSPVTPNPNPFLYPEWYPESAHFVRQWWPTLPDVPRFSCTVLLLASHDTVTHQTTYVLAQHYFPVPLVAPSRAHSGHLDDGGEKVDDEEEAEEDSIMRMWYVSEPFEVVSVFETTGDGEGADTEPERPRPLMAVDFGHAVWVEYIGDEEDEDEDEAEQSIRVDKKALKFATFPVVGEDDLEGGNHEKVRTLEIPSELDLDRVETINIDQSQGAVILSVKEGRVFILRYE